MSDLISRQAAISEEKMQIVINNYFKSECNVDTSIRQAFEKGFRIGIKKGLTAQPERKKGVWLDDEDDPESVRADWYCGYCSACQGTANGYTAGTRMDTSQRETAGRRCLLPRDNKWN